MNLSERLSSRSLASNKVNAAQESPLQQSDAPATNAVKLPFPNHDRLVNAQVATSGTPAPVTSAARGFARLPSELPRRVATAENEPPDVSDLEPRVLGRVLARLNRRSALDAKTFGVVRAGLDARYAYEARMKGHRHQPDELPQAGPGLDGYKKRLLAEVEAIKEMAAQDSSQSDLAAAYQLMGREIEVLLHWVDMSARNGSRRPWNADVKPSLLSDSNVAKGHLEKVAESLINGCRRTDAKACAMKMARGDIEMTYDSLPGRVHVPFSLPQSATGLRAYVARIEVEIETLQRAVEAGQKADPRTQVYRTLFKPIERLRDWAIKSLKAFD